MPPRLLRDQHGLADAVVREPAAEPAAAAQLMQRHLVLRQADERRDALDGGLRRLRGRPISTLSPLNQAVQFCGSRSACET